MPTDTQVKLLWYYHNLIGQPKKKKIISRLKGYHGTSLAAGSLTGLPPFHRHFDLPLPGFLHTESPYYYRQALDGESETDFCDRLANELEALILREGPETIAAFIAEPVPGSRRRHRSSRRLLPQDPGGTGQVPDQSDRRRGDLRIRSYRAGLRVRRPSTCGPSP